MIWKRDWGLVGRQAVAWLVILAIYVAIIAIATYFLKGPILYLIYGFVFISAFVQFFFSDKIVQRTMHVQIVDEYSQPKLIAMIRGISQDAGIPMPKVGIIMHPAMTNIPNAFATGRNKRHSVVAVTTGILPLLNQEELEGVLAHELSHIKNHDMVTMTIAGFIASVASVLLISQTVNTLTGKKSLGEFFIHLIILIVVAVLFVLTLFLTRLLSRYREYAADKGSAIITRNPDAMMSALDKITNGVSITSSSSSAASLPASANLYFIIPAARSMSLFGLFSTHPSLKRRIKNLQKTKQYLVLFY